MALTVTEDHSALDRVASRVATDPVLHNQLGSGLMWAGSRRVMPSGPDQLACVIARSGIADADGVVALAVPRGDRTLPALLGLYLALWRKVPAHGYGRLLGSIAVSTRRSELRDLARNLEFDSSRLDGAIGVGRLVARPVTDQKRMRAAAVRLDGTREFDFLDQQDSWLLFCQPNVAPPVAHQVIGAMVVDTVGCSQGSWEQTYDRNVAARRRQVWVGELGDASYEQFCADRNIPLVRLEWPLLTGAAHRWGTGASRLASTGVAELALDRPPITALIVRHEEVEDWLTQLQFAMHEMRKAARFAADPDVFIEARVAGAVLARCAFPLARYEEAAVKNPFSGTIRQLREHVEWATATPFRGRWKPAFNSHWGGVKVCLRQLEKLMADPDTNPKWWALQTRVETAIANGERVRVLCATRAERDAARTALLSDDSMLDNDALDELLWVSAFSDRGARHTAPVDVTILLGPPVERHSRVYLAAEAGKVEALCFPFELRRLRSRATNAFKLYSDPAAVHDALDAIGTFGPRPANVGPAACPPADELVIEEEGWTEADSGPAELPDYVDRVTPPDPEDEFWDRALELHGSELPDEPPPPTEPEPVSGQGVSTRAHLVSFDDAPPMYLREDAEVTLVTTEDGQPHATPARPGMLAPGDRIAVLPGSERGSLLAELMAAWDEGLATVKARYLPMYYEALTMAEHHCHGAAGLARHVGVHPSTVSTWLRGHNRPQQAAHLKLLLEASRVEKAIVNQAIIAEYFAKTRGAHRLIGRILNDCVQETIVYGSAGGENVAKLRDLVGADLTDLLDDVHVLRVADVQPPCDGVPAGVCGSFLDPDDPYLRMKGAL